MATDIFIEPALSFLAILNLFGAAQGVLLTLALLSGKDAARLPVRILAALTLTLSIIVSGAVLLSSKYVFVFPHLSRVHHPFVFLAGPLVYLYIRALTAPEKRFAKRDFLHFIPFALCLTYLLPYYFKSGAAKLQVLGSEYVQESFGNWYYFRSALFITQFLVYLVLIILTLIKYSQSVKVRDQPHDKAVLFEVRFFVIASLVLWLGAIARYALDTDGTSNLLVPLGGSILVYAMAYLRMRRLGTANREKDELPAKKYEGSVLTEERSARYLNKLLHLMENEQPFTDGDLSIQTLAEKLSIPAPHLSQTINECLGKTFPDFINSYRIEEVKKRLLDPAKKHYTVLAIAEEVGFNSKSSFNDVFKRYVGMTPSEFRKSSGTTTAA
jgi:AraC-like DNA-binding protein